MDDKVLTEFQRQAEAEFKRRFGNTAIIEWIDKETFWFLGFNEEISEKDAQWIIPIMPTLIKTNNDYSFDYAENEYK